MLTHDEYKIVMSSFYEEMGKDAQLLQLGLKGLKLLGKGAKSVFNSSGKLESFSTKALSALSKGEQKAFFAPYAEKTFEKGIGKTVNTTLVKTPENAGFIQTHVADGYKYVKDLGEGVSSQGTLGGKAKQVAKNFWAAEKQQYRQGTYKNVLLENKKTKFYADGRQIINPEEFSKATHIKSGIGTKRKVVGSVFDKDKKLIGFNIKKRAPIRLLNYSMTPTGMVGAGAGFSVVGGGNPITGAKEGLQDAWKWTPVTKGYGLVSGAGELAKSIF